MKKNLLFVLLSLVLSLTAPTSAQISTLKFIWYTAGGQKQVDSIQFVGAGGIILSQVGHHLVISGAGVSQDSVGKAYISDTTKHAKSYITKWAIEGSSAFGRYKDSASVIFRNAHVVQSLGANEFLLVIDSVAWSDSSGVARRAYTADTCTGCPPSSGLPSQTGNAAKFLTTNGTSASWGPVHLDDSRSVTAILGEVNGGTGRSTPFSSGGIVYDASGTLTNDGFLHYNFAQNTLLLGAPSTNLMPGLWSMADNNETRLMWDGRTNTTLANNVISMRNSHGTAATPSVGVSGMMLGKYIFGTISTGTTWKDSVVQLVATIDGAVSSTSTPTRFDLSTTAVGSTVSTRNFSLKPSGNVGIGNTEPTHKLDVNGNANVVGGFTAGSSGGFDVLSTGAAAIGSGSRYIQKVLSDTFTLDFPNLSPGTGTALVVELTGLTYDSTWSINVSYASTGLQGTIQGVVVNYWQDDDNDPSDVLVQVFNANTLASVNLPPILFRVTAVKF